MKRIVLDGFFHMPPGHRLSRNIATGGYRTNYGRYFPFDTFHPNGSSMLFADLLGSFDLRILQQPYSDLSLADADILIIPNPDYPLYEGASPYRIGQFDLDALIGFLGRGGSVILMINSFLSRADFWEENFDLERIAPLFDRLGLRWDHNFMSDEHRILPANAAGLTVGYGQGGRVFDARLPRGAQPLLTFDNQIFGFEIEIGRGRLAVIGDAGLVSNGLYHFPGFDNAAFLRKLIEDLSPRWSANGPFELLEFGHLSCATSEYGIDERIFRALRPQAKWTIDHHYRHLTFESKPILVANRDTQAKLPVSPAQAAGQTSLKVRLPFIAVSDGRAAQEFEITAYVSEKNSETGTEYVIAGTALAENPTWADVGADPAVFGPIGQLLRVSSVLRIHAGTDPEGSLRYYTMQQGQITYDRNTKNPQYGFDLMLASRNLVLARTSAPAADRKG